MQKIFALFSAFSILLSACAGSLANVSRTPIALTSTYTVTPPKPTLTAEFIPTLKATITLFPSKTPGPPTQFSPSPFPVYPTFTPTFDVRTIVTATPAPKAECPPPSKDIKFVAPTQNPFIDKTNYRERILDFLNQGGDIHSIFKLLVSIDSKDVVLQDVTNDGVPELIVAWGAVEDGGYIIGCNPMDSKYQLLYQAHQFNPDYYSLLGVRDMNVDGIPEVAMIDSVRGSAIFITEWKGDKFENLILDDTGSNDMDWAGALYLASIQLIDLDQNGTIELVWKGGVDLPWSLYNLLKSPYRQEIYTYAWDGEHFVPQPMRYASPVYRYQAVQDADQNTLLGEYKLAFAAYQDAIFSEKLDAWSEERYEQLGARLETWDGTPTPTAFPEDKTEYPRLAAYAYYRMVILHTYLGEMDAAKVKYATLQEKFPTGNPGHPYVEVATDFWNAYQASGKMYDACAAAIAYADKHSEILIPLGSDYHGSQSHTYFPADVCPFR